MAKGKEMVRLPAVIISRRLILIVLLIFLLIIIYLLYGKSSPPDQRFTIRTPSVRPTLKIYIVSPPPEDLFRQTHLELAIDDLSKKLNIAKDIIKVVGVEPVEFSDSSLGCVEKNVMYAQVITPGIVINLEVLGQIYTYNAGLNRVVSCKRN